jgi:hypothetical protein
VKDHSCTREGCNVRFCEKEREPGFVYVKGLTKYQKRFLRADLKNYCLDCLKNYAAENKSAVTEVNKTLQGLESDGYFNNT